jgi:hypothetical protein
MKLAKTAGVLFVLCAFLLVSCKTPITPIETKVIPNVITLAKINSKGIDPLNSNDWLSPTWLTPEDWWRSLPTTQPPRFGPHGVVGFEILFDTQGSASKFRQDLYRVGFSYNLAPHQNLRGLVTKAELTFSSAILPPGVSPNSSCQPLTGGGGGLIVLAPAATLPAAPQRMAYLGSANAAAPYPSGTLLFSIPQGPPQVWLGRTIAPGVTAMATGQGTASFTVDVTALVNAALDRGATALSFMISGSDEANVTVFPRGPVYCKTTYRIDDLVITHL